MVSLVCSLVPCGVAVAVVVDNDTDTNTTSDKVSSKADNQIRALCHHIVWPSYGDFTLHIGNAVQLLFCSSTCLPSALA